MTAVVVGAGFSGVMAARELVRAGWQVVLVDPGARPGRGVAYGTTVPWHLLNSPASSMSIDPDDPEHFVRWAGVDPGDFVARSRYGDYLSEALREVDGLGSLTVHRGQVGRIFEASGGGLTVLLTDDVVIPADRVVLAVGNPPPAQPFPVAAGVTGYVADPWAEGALDALPEGPVLLIGTGLTAVDVALTLAQSGLAGSITAVSRHGLLPRAHAPHAKLPVSKPASTTLSGLMREIRQLPGDWRSVMDGLRPHWNELWRRLSPADQQRFLRHVARYWEVHRHRMAPAVARAIDGIFAVRKAEVCGVLQDGVVLRDSHGIEARQYSTVVNCTGPGPVTSHRLVRSLIADGLACGGPLGLGLATDEHGALIGRSARRGQIYTLGPARRGGLWETTAAPEIRAQARALAVHLGSQATGLLKHTPAMLAEPEPAQRPSH